MASSRIVLPLVTLAALCRGLSIVPCSSNGTVSVEEDSKDFTLGCKDLNMQNPTSWSYTGRHPSDPRELVSVCSRTSASPPWSCASNFSVLILATINEHTTRSHVILPDVIRERFPDGTWRCENGVNSAAECSLDVIYTPRDVQCHVTVDETQGMVSGSCQTSKMFSSHGHYSCQWFEKNGNETEAEISSSVTAFTLTDCSEGSKEYLCGYCSFSKLLPFVSESYSYRALISPGSVSPSIAYSIVKRNANGSSSSQVAPSTSINRMTSTQSMTSSSANASPNAGFTRTRPSQRPPIVAIDIDVINSARYEGFGIGVASAFVLLFLIATIVLLFCKCRRRRKEEPPEENIHNSIVNRGYDSSDFSGSLQENHPTPTPPHHISLPLPPHFRGSFGSRCLQSEADYASIATPFASDNGSYLVPVGQDVRKSSTAEKIPFGDCGKGQNLPRRLPPVPAKNAKRISVTEAVTSSVSGSVVATGGSHDDKDKAYKTQISLDLPALPPLGYETMHPPFSTKTNFHIADDGKVKESEKAEEEKENMQNEKAEQAEAIFLSSGFQMKDAEYIHMNNTGIPPSEPI